MLREGSEKGPRERREDSRKSEARRENDVSAYVRCIALYVIDEL